MILVHFFIALLASLIGAISGIGGGIIIKPLLDILGFFDIEQINFISGITVLSMTSAALLRSRKLDVSINGKAGVPIALGSVVGGVGGKYLFNLMIGSMNNLQMVSVIQSVMLFVLVFGVFAFTLFRSRITPHHNDGRTFCFFIGLLLGGLGAFLGVGGGPVNVVVFYFFLSMDSRNAALNSIFLIFFSQLTSLLFLLIGGRIPSVDIGILIFMIIGGIAGGTTGSHLSVKLSSKKRDILFIAVLILLMSISVSNIIL